MTHDLNLKFERALRLLAEYFPVADADTRKPVLFHDVRVGVYLYEHHYAEEIVLAGLLHDALEFSNLSEERIASEFGAEVLRLVKACTKDDTIKDKQEKIEELIRRSADYGESALIIKAVDILDSFKFYTLMKNDDQLDYCRATAVAILAEKRAGWEDGVFEEVRGWVENRGEFDILD